MSHDPVKFNKDLSCRMSLSLMSYVKIKKWPCRPVDFRGKGSSKYSMVATDAPPRGRSDKVSVVRGAYVITYHPPPPPPTHTHFPNMKSPWGFQLIKARDQIRDRFIRTHPYDPVRFMGWAIVYVGGWVGGGGD